MGISKSDFYTKVVEFKLMAFVLKMHLNVKAPFSLKYRYMTLGSVHIIKKYDACAVVLSSCYVLKII